MVGAELGLCRLVHPDQPLRLVFCTGTLNGIDPDNKEALSFSTERLIQRDESRSNISFLCSCDLPDRKLQSGDRSGETSSPHIQ